MKENINILRDRICTLFKTGIINAETYQLLMEPLDAIVPVETKSIITQTVKVDFEFDFTQGVQALQKVVKSLKKIKTTP